MIRWLYNLMLWLLAPLWGVYLLTRILNGSLVGTVRLHSRQSDVQ